MRTAPFPVVLLAHERAGRLNVTLTSLLHVRGIDRAQIFVLQDGNDEAVRGVVRAMGLMLVPLSEVAPPSSRTAHDAKSGKSIALAYRAALSTAFDVLTSDDALIVVEDDMLFSPDLMDFFLAGYHVMRGDRTLWCVSAWNDNGFRGMVNARAAPRRLLRTGFFPGLGWLLTRKLYKGELEAVWPSEHWDHWMRSERVHRTSKGRECLYPHVPRAFHHGAVGTFMTKLNHAESFAHIAYSTDVRLTWPHAEWEALAGQLSAKAYEARLRARLKEAVPLVDFARLRRAFRRTAAAEAGGGPDGGAAKAEAAEVATVAIWYDMHPRSTVDKLWRDLAQLIGVWHEIRRAAHNGVHELWCGPSLELLLVNMRHGPTGAPSPYADLAPPPSSIFTTSAGLRKAAGAKGGSGLCRDTSRPLNVREDRLPPPRATKASGSTHRRSIPPPRTATGHRR